MKLKLAPLVLTVLAGTSIAQADVATYSTVPVTGCPTCTVTDPTGLEADATGHQVYGYPGGWDVWANATDHLVVANGIGVDFSLPQRTFNFDKLKMFGLASNTKTTSPLTFNLIVYHPDTTYDVIPFTIPARVVSTVDFTGYTQTKNASKVTVSYPATSFIGKTYYIETTFTPQ